MPENNQPEHTPLPKLVNSWRKRALAIEAKETDTANPVVDAWELAANELANAYPLAEKLASALEEALHELKIRIDWSMPNDERTIEAIKVGEEAFAAWRAGEPAEATLRCDLSLEPCIVDPLAPGCCVHFGSVDADEGAFNRGIFPQPAEAVCNCKTHRCVKPKQAANGLCGDCDRRHEQGYRHEPADTEAK